MKPRIRIARVTSLFAASAGLIVAMALVHPRVGQVVAFASTAPPQTTRLSFEAEFPAASVGQPYMQSLKASGGVGGYRFAEDGELPPGMQWVPAGDGLLLRGTPTKAGEYPLRILVNDADGQQITRDVTFKVTPDSNPAAVPVMVNETLTTTDAVSVLLPVVVNVNESLTTTDAVSVLLPLVVNVNETLTTTDAVSPVVESTTSASLTPTSQDFGSAAVGFFSPSSEQTFTLTNTGQTVLTSTAVTVTGTNVSSFQVAGNGCIASLAVDSNCSIYVFFEPAATGPLTATLNVISTGSTGTVTQTSSLTGTGLPGPTLTVMPNPVSFPTTSVNTTAAPITVTLTNTGNGQLGLNGTQVGTLGGADAAHFTFSAGNCGYSGLATGASCSGSVTFTPNAARTFNATLSIPSNDVHSPAVIPLTGTGGTAPTATLTPATYNYGTVTVGSSATNVFTLTNSGTSALTVSSPTVTGPYSVSANTCTAPLAANATCTITVAFSPTTTGTTSDTLSLTDTTGDHFTASLSGTGGGVSSATITPNPYNFGTVALGSSGSNVFTVTNTGSLALTFGSPVTSAPYSVSANTCTAPLAANATCTITVAFSPTTTGTTSGTLSLTDTTGDHFTASLSGTGGGMSSATITPNPYNFGTVALGSSATNVFTVTNTGSLALTLSATVAAPYSISANTCGTSSIAVNGNCTITVAFTPTAAGTTPGTLTLTDPMADTFTASLSGTGGVRSATITPNPYDFGTVVVGSTATNVFTVTNTGSLALSFASPTVTGPYSISANTCTASLAVSSTCTITVAFTPITTGTTNGMLTLTDAAGDTFTALLHGTGGGVSSATITPAPYNFGTVNVGSAATNLFTVTNTGTLALSFSNPVTSAPYSIAANTCTASLAVNATCTITVAFTPTAAGTTLGTLTLTDFTGDHFTASLSGTGLVAYVFVVNSGGSVSSLYINGSTQSSAVAGGGIGAAVDRNGLVFSITADGTGVSTFNDDGTLENTTSGVLTGASALAIDGGDQLWIASPGSVSVGQILGSGQTSIADPTLLQPSGIAIDLSGNVWISDSQSNTVHEVVGGAAPVLPLANAVQTNTLGVEP